MARVFISYRRGEPDATIARRLYQFLSELEHDVFLDVTRIRVGDAWSAQIAKKLAAAEYFVPIVSPRFLTSTFIRDHELAPAVQRFQSGGLAGILPISVTEDGSEPAIIDSLSGVQHAVWRGRGDMREVLRAIASRLPGSVALIRGGRSFDESDAAVYAQVSSPDTIRRFVELLRRERFVLLHGVSGAGKTSFLKAGVAPAASDLGLVVVEIDEGDPVANLLRACEQREATIVVDQFEQCLLQFAATPELHRAFEPALGRCLEDDNQRLVLCMRDEYRTAFDVMFPLVADRFARFPLLPFEPSDAAQILATLLDSGGVEYDTAFLLPLCTGLSEGVPRTVVPAILQVTAQRWRALGLPLNARTWNVDDTRRLFDAHVRDSVLREIPQSISEVESTSALLGLVHGNVKGPYKSIDEIANERKVRRAAVERTMDVASAQARIVSHDTFSVTEEPRYRLAHDLFAAPIRRLHALARQRRDLQRAIGVAIVILLFAVGAAFAAAAAFENWRNARAISARGDYERSFSERQLGRVDSAALLAARAVTTASPASEDVGTYTLTALHHALALPVPLYVPQDAANATLLPHTDALLVTDGDAAFVLDPLTGARHPLPSPDPDWTAFAVDPSARIAASTFRVDGGVRSFLVDLRSGTRTSWSGPQSVSASLAFTADGSLLVETDGQYLRTHRANGSIACHDLRSPDLMFSNRTLSLAAGRVLSVTGPRLTVYDLGTCTPVAPAIPAGAAVKSAAISANGRFLAVATERTGGVDLAVWDVATASRRATTHLDIKKRPLAPKIDFDVYDVNDAGMMVAGAANDERVYWWDTSAAIESEEIPGFDFHYGGTSDLPPRLAFFLQGGRVLATFSGGSTFSHDVGDPHGASAPVTFRTWTAHFRQWGPKITMTEQGSRVVLARDPRYARFELLDGRVFEYDLLASVTRDRDLGNDIRTYDMSGDLETLLVGRAEGGQALRVVSAATGVSRGRELLAPYAHESLRARLRHGHYVAVWWPHDQRPGFIQVVDVEKGTALFPQPLQVDGPVNDVTVDADGRNVSILVSSFGSVSPAGVIRLPAGSATVPEAVPIPRSGNGGAFHDDAASTIVFDGSDGTSASLQFHDANHPARAAAFFTYPSSRIAPVALRTLVHGARVEIVNDREMIIRRTGMPVLRFQQLDYEVVVTEEASGRRLRLPEAPEAKFEYGALSHSGRYLALAAATGVDDALQVWDLYTGSPVMPAHVLSSSIDSLAFTADDAAVRTLAYDGVIRRWPVGRVPRPASFTILREITSRDQKPWSARLATITTSRRLENGSIRLIAADEHRRLLKDFLNELAANTTDPNAALIRSELLRQRSVRAPRLQ